MQVAQAQWMPQDGLGHALNALRVLSTHAGTASSLADGLDDAMRVTPGARLWLQARLQVGVCSDYSMVRVLLTKLQVQHM